MKIVFIWGNLDTPEDLTTIGDEQYLCGGYNTEFYYHIKALEKNDDFIKDVNQIRKQLKIPQNGYKWQNYILDNFFNFKVPMRKKGANEHHQIIRIIKDTSDQIIELSNKYNLSGEVRDQLQNIVFANYCLIPPSIIEGGLFALSEDDFEAGIYQSYQINIFRDISRNELDKFLEKNWQKIQKSLQSLPSINSMYISKRDYRVVELRDNADKSFPEIADIVVNEFYNGEDFDGKINDKSMAEAYKRAKEKIRSLTKLKSKQKVP